MTAAKEVAVYGLNRRTSTTDAYLGLPVDVLGRTHTVMAWGAERRQLRARGRCVAGRHDRVDHAGRRHGDGHAAGEMYTLQLDRGQAYQAQGDADLTGTTVLSDKPVAVFGGHQCANVPSTAFQACDHLVEQQPPDEAWGTRFETVRLMTRERGDTFRILASQPGTDVRIDGALVATLAAGRFHTRLVSSASEITASKPVLVAQFANSSAYDNVLGDPFMMLVAPFEQYQLGYVVSTPDSGFETNALNVVVPADAVGTVKVDGTAIPASDYKPIGSGEFAGVQLEVTLGSHAVTGGGDPFAVSSYGFGSFDSYGYPGGLSVAPVARVGGLTIDPVTETRDAGTEGCVTAKVVDRGGHALEGVRVDFAVSGANAQTGSSSTDGGGATKLCYTGAASGTDTITASVGTRIATATKTWRIVQRATRMVANPVVADVGLLRIYLAPTAKLEALDPVEPLAGKQVTFKVGSTVLCSATSAADGSARCSGALPLLQSVLALGKYSASFAGDSRYKASSATGSLLTVGTARIP